MLKHAALDRKEYKGKLKIVFNELEFDKSSVVVCDEFACDACAFYMSNLATLQTKYATLLDKLEEVKARPILLGVCKSWSGLQSEMAEKNTKIYLLEKANS